MERPITNALTLISRHAGKLVSIVVLIICAVASATAAPGDLDPTFGVGGIVRTPMAIPPDFSRAASVRVQPDGKVVVCGQIDREDFYGDYYPISFFIGRYLPTGAIDNAFGTNGRIIGPFAFSAEHVGEDIALQTDGKIVAVGHQRPGTYHIAVNRYNSDGTLDTTFGVGGRVVTSVEGSFSFGTRIVVQADGRILVAGYSHLGSGNFAFVLVRYNAKGTLDSGFGAGGKVVTPIGNNYVSVGALMEQPDGKVVVAGGSGVQNDFTLVRYTPDGALDLGFGNGGKVIHRIENAPATFYDAVLQPDGKILAGGTSNGQAVIIRYRSTGAMDTSFAVEGIFRPNFGYGLFNQPRLALQGDGKIVAVGRGVDVLRLRSDGTLDPGFGINGYVTTPLGGAFSSANSLAVQTDGKIVALAHIHHADSSTSISVLRYRGDSVTSSPARFDFDGDRRSDISVFRPSDRVWYLNRSQAGFTALQFGLADDAIAPADFDGDEKTDIAVFRAGIWYWLNSSDNSFHAVHFGSPGDIPVPEDYNGDGGSELAIYRTGTWWMFDLASQVVSVVQFGLPGDRPVAADYDGDGKVDQAVYRNGEWHLNRSTQGNGIVYWGLATDKPVPADYDGDGKTDPAVYRDGTWYLLQSSQGWGEFQWGLASDIPAPADYDGDGRTDAAVYRDGFWYLRQSTSGVSVQQFGLGGDRPVPAAYVP